jgi:hypothetical protein
MMRPDQVEVPTPTNEKRPPTAGHPMDPDRNQSKSEYGKTGYKLRE